MKSAVSRRKFLQASAATAAGTALSPALIGRAQAASLASAFALALQSRQMAATDCGAHQETHWEKAP